MASRTDAALDVIMDLVDEYVNWVISHEDFIADRKKLKANIEGVLEGLSDSAYFDGIDIGTESGFRAATEN